MLYASTIVAAGSGCVNLRVNSFYGVNTNDTVIGIHCVADSSANACTLSGMGTETPPRIENPIFDASPKSPAGIPKPPPTLNDGARSCACTVSFVKVDSMSTALSSVMAILFI